jgi:NAD(P)-dependent dehydrogenase (short-subunit alcohol dehydrogenase family)
MTLSGKSVLITAGAGGAGLGIARQFRLAGALVTVCDVDAEAVARANAEGFAAIVADVAGENAVEAVFALAEERHGPVDTLVNNVGIAGPTARVEDVTFVDWERTMAVNIGSHFLCIRRAVPAMKRAGTGCIINISSGSAKVGLPLRVPYVVSKGAVLSLTTTLARELGPSGIRVNAILPGALRGERMVRFIAAKAEALGVEAADYEKSLLKYISLRTTVDPEDVAAMAILMASDAGRRISGQCVGVDGNIEWEE